MQSKQDLIDATHAQLRECSAMLGDERRKLETLQKKANERAKRQEKIANLRRAAHEQRMRLAQAGMVNGDSGASTRLGDADAGLAVATDDMPASLLLHLSDPNTNAGSALLDGSAVEFLAGMPPAAVLRARLAAYENNNARLRDQAAALRSRSSDLEAQYRRVISLCTGAPEGEVEKLLAGLVEAIESEGAEVMELGRLREFLRRVEGVEG